MIVSVMCVDSIGMACKPKLSATLTFSQAPALLLAHERDFFSFVSASLHFCLSFLSLFVLSLAICSERQMIVTNWVFCLFVDDCSRHNENEEVFG